MPARNNTNTKVTIQKVNENVMLGTSRNGCIRYHDYNLRSLKNIRKCDVAHRQC